MTTIVTRETGATAKNSPLTNTEIDQNFINLNDNKLEAAKSGTADEVPVAANLAYGQVVINYADGKLYYKKADGTTVDAFESLYARNRQYVATVSAATTALDLGAYDNFVLTLSANTTFTVSNVAKKVGGSGTIIIKQDATGGRTFTKATQMKTPIGGAGIAQTTTANSLSVLSYYVVDASTILINYIGNFA
jgi:hypothetical protein